MKSQTLLNARPPPRRPGRFHFRGNRRLRKPFGIKASSKPLTRSRQHNPLPDVSGGLSILKLREEATRPARKQKKAKLPNGNTLTGVTKQFTCSAPEPVSPTGTKAPKLRAATLRVASTNADSPRFMGTIKGRLRQSPLSMNRRMVSLISKHLRIFGSWSQCAPISASGLSMNRWIGLLIFKGLDG